MRINYRLLIVSGIKIDLEKNREENIIIDCINLIFRRCAKGDKKKSKYLKLIWSFLRWRNRGWFEFLDKKNLKSRDNILSFGC